MRDDVAEIISKLTELHSQKLSALKRLALIQADMLYSIKSGNEHQYFSLAEEFNHIRENIDAADCDISTSEDTLTAIMGISNGRLERMIQSSDEFMELKNLRNECRALFESMSKKHSLLVEEMESQKLEAEKGIKELRNMRKYKSDLME